MSAARSSTRAPRGRWWPRGALGCILACLLSNCVTVYQPLVALQRPVVLAPDVANFEGARVLLRCVPGDWIDAADSRQLCKNLRALFTSQGAQVDVEVPRGRGAGLGRGEAGAEATKPDLVVDLSARLLHEENSALLWALSLASLTLVPAITEYTFAQDIVIRDAQGFQLAADTLEARFERTFGLLVWAVNGWLDLLVRPKSEALLGDAYRQDFSRDFYGQLTQLAFHARMRAQVMRSFQPAAPEGTR
jgi:hypothetical protein